ncbi:MAG: hypothetical protein KBA61_08430 [Spirochaetes bacterium]|nr:hypothetical protein [Spirochaetota bacterium]
MTEASKTVLGAVRSTENVQWYVVPLLIFVIYVYVAEAEKKNWDAFFIGIAVWAGELIWEMFNGLILHFTQFAPLWSTPGRSAYILYSGLNIEIAAFFAVGGIIVVKSLPADRNAKILGVPNRLFLPAFWGVVSVTVEVLLNRAGLLVWDWWWWGWPHIYLVVAAYMVPWFGIVIAYDRMTMAAKKRWAAILAVAAVLCHAVLALWLRWI